MSNRNAFTRLTAVVAGSLVLGAAGAPIVAQVAAKPAIDTLKRPATKQGSSADTLKHIKIVKEPQQAGKPAPTRVQTSSPGEVCSPVVCAIGPDSLNRAVIAAEQAARAEQIRLDSIVSDVRVRDAIGLMRAAAREEKETARRDSIGRADAAEREAQLALRRQSGRGFYVGIAGGASAPQRDIRNGYTGGWNVTLPVGWDLSDSPLGFRVDGSVDHMNGTRIHDQTESTIAASGDITVWSLNSDMKLRAHAPGASSRTNLYALGGVGVHRVVNGVYGTTGANAGQNLAFGAAKTNFGWNAGVGASMAWGPTELFIESRFFQVKSDLGYHLNGGVGTYTSFTPIVFGLQWF